MSLVQDARQFAIEMHGEQKRKYTNEPYVVHPEAVAFTIASLDMPPAVIAAAWLHDVVEDTAATIEDVRRAFGPEVALYVGEVTDVATPADGNRQKRTELNRLHYRTAGPYGQSIKLADMIDNTSSITRYDPNFARTYMAEKALLLPFLQWGHPALRARAAHLLEDYETGQVQNALRYGGRRA